MDGVERYHPIEEAGVGVGRLQEAVAVECPVGQNVLLELVEGELLCQPRCAPHLEGMVDVSDEKRCRHLAAVLYGDEFRLHLLVDALHSKAVGTALFTEGADGVARNLI